MTSQYRQGRVRLATSALAALPLLALLLFAPSPAPAAQSLSNCTDGAWSEYNGCLMDASTEWMRTGCDVGFSAEYALCWANYLGGFKNLFS